MADYWMKLYIEILDDPKMATLPDRIWRRIIELFLVAKRVNQEGHLPDTRQIAWVLRMAPDELETDMLQIAATGIIDREVNGWFIPNFSQRQSAVTGAERKTQERNRKKSRQYYENVTPQSRFVTQRQNTESESETEIETEAEAESLPPNVYTLYEREIGVITPMIADQLKYAETEYPYDWFCDATKEAVGHNARNLKYILAILQNWKVNGRGSGHKRQSETLADAFMTAKI